LYQKLALYLITPTIAFSNPMSPTHTNGICFFLTGLSGAGKTTIAAALEQALTPTRTVTMLDGDVVRTHLSRELGFSREDRDTNIRRIAFVASEVVKHGGIVIAAAIAPYDAVRREAQERVGANGRFVLVHVATTLDVCEARDTKGLYARARRGELAGFTGISDPYEPPTNADIRIDTSVTPVAEAVRLIRAHAAC
jgi:adenylyl-sulfate kinase